MQPAWQLRRPCVKDVRHACRTHREEGAHRARRHPEPRLAPPPRWTGRSSSSPRPRCLCPVGPAIFADQPKYPIEDGLSLPRWSGRSPTRRGAIQEATRSRRAGGAGRPLRALRLERERASRSTAKAPEAALLAPLGGHLRAQAPAGPRPRRRGRRPGSHGPDLVRRAPEPRSERDHRRRPPRQPTPEKPRLRRNGHGQPQGRTAAEVALSRAASWPTS